jgi:hypothetical protein
MRAPRTALPVFLAAVLAGCATASMHKISGYAPDDGSCRVLVLESGTRRVLHAEPVRGKFSVSFGLDDEFPGKVHVQGECNGKTVRELSNIVPGVIGVTDLGSIGP